MDIQWFKSFDEPEQIEILQSLWHEDKLDEYFTLLDTFPRKRRNEIYTDIECGIQTSLCAYDEVVDFSYA